MDDYTARLSLYRLFDCVEFSPGFIFMLANFIVLAIFISSSKSSNAAPDDNSSMISSSCDKSVEPFNHAAIHEADFCNPTLSAFKAISNCYGGRLQLSATSLNPTESLNPLRVHPLQWADDRHSASGMPSTDAYDFSERISPKIRDGGCQLPAPPFSPNETLTAPLHRAQPLDLHAGRDGHTALGAAAERDQPEALSGASKASAMADPADAQIEDLNKKFDDFINTFFARIRAEMPL